MEEKERYKLESYNEAFCQIHDTESDEWYLRKDLVKDLLNQQDKHIKELEEENQQLKQSQKQLAIEELERLKHHFLNLQNTTLGLIKRADFVDYLNTQIKELGDGNV